MIRERLQKVDRFVFGPFFEQYHSTLEAEIVGSSETLLDVGCGFNSPVRKFAGKLKHTVGIDCYEPV
jgi:hypothetical protein